MKRELSFQKRLQKKKGTPLNRPVLFLSELERAHYGPVVESESTRDVPCPGNAYPSPVSGIFQAVFVCSRCDELRSSVKDL